MIAPLKSRGSRVADDTATSILRVPCPVCPPSWREAGAACLICDDATFSVVVTEIELAALGLAAQGRPVETTLASRLRMLDLLHDVAGYTVPTEKGFALLGSVALRSN